MSKLIPYRDYLAILNFKCPYYAKLSSDFPDLVKSCLALFFSFSLALIFDNIYRFGMDIKEILQWKLNDKPLMNCFALNFGIRSFWILLLSDLTFFKVKL